MDQLEVRRRQEVGTRAARRLRRGGSVPGVIYGHGREPQPVEVDARALRALHLAEHAGLLRLSLEGEGMAALVKETQVHPITGQYRSVDFQAVSLEEKVTVAVPVHLVGTPVGISQGGVLQHIMRELQVSCKASDIPAHIEVDVSELEVTQAVHRGEVAVPPGVELIGAREELVVLVAAPTKPEEEAKPAEAEAAEVPAEGAEAEPAEEETTS